MRVNLDLNLRDAIVTVMKLSDLGMTEDIKELFGSVVLQVENEIAKADNLRVQNEAYQDQLDKLQDKYNSLQNRHEKLCLREQALQDQVLRLGGDPLESV